MSNNYGGAISTCVKPIAKTRLGIEVKATIQKTHNSPSSTAYIIFKSRLLQLQDGQYSLIKYISISALPLYASKLGEQQASISGVAGFYRELI